MLHCQHLSSLVHRNTANNSEGNARESENNCVTPSVIGEKSAGKDPGTVEI
jgi:hypothetical protein